jgi:hypothetical protein
MTNDGDLIVALSGIAGTGLRQERRPIVVQPQNADEAAAIVRAARDHAHLVMPLGSGSSFPPDFSMLRDDVVVVQTVRMRTVQTVSPFSTRVEAGVPVSFVVQGISGQHKTVGGLLNGGHHFAEDQSILAAIWACARNLEIVFTDGSLRQFPVIKSGIDSGSFLRLIAGSRGRAALVTAIEIAPPFPIRLENTGDDHQNVTNAGYGEPVITTRDIQMLFDRSSLFQW